MYGQSMHYCTHGVLDEANRQMDSVLLHGGSATPTGHPEAGLESTTTHPRSSPLVSRGELGLMARRQWHRGSLRSHLDLILVFDGANPVNVPGQ